MGLFGAIPGGLPKAAVPAGLAAAAAVRNRSPEADGYNTIYEKDGEYYTREKNPDYKTMDQFELPRKSGILGGILPKVLGKHINKMNEGVDPYIYTAVANPYAPAEATPAVEEFAEGSAAPSVNIMPQPQQAPQQPAMVYDPYTMPRGLGDVQNPLFSGLQGNY